MIEKAHLKELINNPLLISDLRFDDISKILHNAKDIFEKENLLLEFNLKDNDKEIYVIGDIHGNLDSLLKLLEIINENHPEVVIFLGDIVDRGPKQLECLLVVLALKILDSHKYFLLKGNHETLEMNQYYGFFQDFIYRFKNADNFNEILNIYNILPICAIVNNTILCLHGGIPQDNDILKKLRGIKTNEIESILSSISSGVFQIIWNDPKAGLKGFAESFRGSGIKFFGEDVFDHFMKKNNLTFLIRAHECFPEGYRWFFNNRLLSIFSSTNYRGIYAPNPASYAIIRDNKIIPRLLEL
ncbi:MAG: metallophosphoesterase [Candidatus Thorarchaeota archaeon]